MKNNDSLDAAVCAARQIVSMITTSGAFFRVDEVGKNKPPIVIVGIRNRHRGVQRAFDPAMLARAGICASEFWARQIEAEYRGYR